MFFFSNSVLGCDGNPGNPMNGTEKKKKILDPPVWCHKTYQKSMGSKVVNENSPEPKGNDLRPGVLGLQCRLWGPAAVLEGMQMKE